MLDKYEGQMMHVGQQCCARSVLQGQAYTDAGATAYDAVDGALDDVVTTGLSLINTMVVSPNNSCVAQDSQLLQRTAPLCRFTGRISLLAASLGVV